ncbi:putative ABC transport system permease protein [Dysgonomonas alginatilytica]|uniref:Putative ABC transport system permease protein n=1 Tax=Dysgonomonas alginatilytica TaxID=1605892 RepID=A0A2V3PTC8_9BACT|nr:FtsX-like permease family protein [Dysgonomonas alginatilytica]PXV66791.1 putative ABC transport system permease protein [Dysgonomonas alginatilytica]
MNNFNLIIRSLFKKKENNIIKILSLGTGLAVGLIIISKVFFELSYDNFYPDSERIYLIQSVAKVGTAGNEETKEYVQVSGAIAPGMKAEVPEVESATRITYMGWKTPFYTPDKKYYTGTFIMADSCFFDVLPRPMIVGNAKEILARPLYALVSESIAQKMGGNVVGQSIQHESYPGRRITIGGIFKDVPENTHLKYDIVVSLVSIKNFSYDGSLDWLGNDRYLGYVKLMPGTDPASLAPAIRQMQERNQSMEDMKKAGIDLSYTLLPLEKLNSDNPEAKRMTLLLSAIAFALIFTSIMNYILILISTLVNRGKVISIYKCYGAEKKDISKLIFGETFFHLIISLVISILLIFCFRGTAEEILSVSVDSLFSLRTCLFLGIICILISLIIGFIPSYLFSRIPVASVFRNLTGTRRGWKMALLFFQLLTTTFLVTLLVIVSRQYDVLVNVDPGYNYEKLLYYRASGMNENERQKIIDELRALSEVEMIATADQLPFYSQSGNNVFLPNDERELFNIADLYGADENYLSLMKIPIIEGKGFDKETSNKGDVIVSRKFADKLSEIANWKDGAIGKDIRISEHDACRIVGVYNDIRIGSVSNEDRRPSAIFYSDKPAEFILIKMNELQSDNIQKVYDVLKKIFPEKDITLPIYKDSIVQIYYSSRQFLNAITIGGIVTLIITLIGLIGYTTHEVNRRRSEIAIRRVNGATISDILKLFVKDNLWIVFPALVCGGIAAAIAAAKWMEDFSEKTELSPLLFISCGTAVLVTVLSVVCLNCLYTANQNPVDTLKTD